MARELRGLGTFVAVVALIVGACTGTTPTPTPTPTIAVTVPTPSPSIIALATETPEPTATPAPAPSAEPEETPAPTPAPTQTPAPAKGWTVPQPVGTAQCDTVSAGIDSASRYHIAAECGGSVNYWVSDGHGSWTTTVFAHPADRQDLDPQIAFRGNVVYVAFTRIKPDGGCGGGAGPPVGVFFRSRTQPDGAWSEPVSIGSPDDNLQSFRVDGPTIHATVSQGDGGGTAYYETLNGSTYHRYPIPGSIGQTSLRIGSDGRARIAFEAATGIRYAVFTGSGFTTSPVAGGMEGVLGPVLVLDAKDGAHVVWTRTEPGACGEIPVGTYYATNASGTWVAQRITKGVGGMSLQIDGTGRVDLIVGVGSGLWYYSATPTGPWTQTRIVAVGVQWPTLRLDPATGTLLVVYMDGSSAGMGRIYTLTRP
jgi:hypothetical protein